MNRKALNFTLCILVLVLVAELAFLGAGYLQEEDISLFRPETGETRPPVGTLPVEEPTEPATLPTEEPTEPEETLPPDEVFVLSFTGDCTLGSTPAKAGTSGSFVKVVGEDYTHPFREMAPIFQEDDLTLANLESVIGENGTGASKTFIFRGPKEYTQILTSGSVEAVTIANNHAKDYGTKGYEGTKENLTEAGIAYVEDYSTMIYTTQRGLVVGVCAADGSVNAIKTDKVLACIQELKDAGVHVIVCAFHWGNEGQYRPTDAQKELGKAAIDAGADIVWGNHPHVLQPIEAYNGGIIFYSLGNFSFGGNSNPRDLDGAVMQQQVILHGDGTVSLGELTILPISISSAEKGNNYQPILCAEDSEQYKRILTKLDGTFDGDDLVVDYSHLR